MSSVLPGARTSLGGRTHRFRAFRTSLRFPSSPSPIESELRVEEYVASRTPGYPVPRVPARYP
eukprot:2814952-Rhodomonas_salina.1